MMQTDGNYNNRHVPKEATVDSVAVKIPNDAVITDSEIRPPKSPKLSPATTSDATKSDSHLYIGGRYIKFSRTLSQTPWFITKNQRKTSNSVEEIITEPINRALQPVSISFMSAGREDVDARCLGNGRPFALDVRGGSFREDPERQNCD